MLAKTVQVDAASPDPQIIRRAAEMVVQGLVIVCPTDTGYAFAANAIDTKAVARVFDLKGRDFSKPMHIAVSSLEEAAKYAHINQAAGALARHFLPGALTLVLPRKEIVPSLLVGGRDTVGIRIPDNRVVLALAGLTGLPLTATSANLSGKPTPYAVGEIRAQLGKAMKGVALVLDQGTLPKRELSTIVDLTVSPPQLIRQGRVSWLEVLEVWQSL